MYSARLSKLDLVSILIPNVVGAIAGSIIQRDPNYFIRSFAVHSSSDILTHIFKSNIDDFKNRTIGSLTNKDLITILNKYGYREGRDYTVDSKKSPITINLNNGILLVSMEKGANDGLVKLLKKFNSQITDMGKFTFISYQAAGRSELEKVLNSVMKYAKKVDIYDNR